MLSSQALLHSPALNTAPPSGLSPSLEVSRRTRDSITGLRLVEVDLPIDPQISLRSSNPAMMFPFPLQDRIPILQFPPEHLSQTATSYAFCKSLGHARQFVAAVRSFSKASSRPLSRPKLTKYARVWLQPPRLANLSAHIRMTSAINSQLSCQSQHVMCQYY